MPTLVYKGSGCRRITKGTMINVVPRSNSNQITPHDIEDALERMGYDHDEISYCRNLRDWEDPSESRSSSFGGFGGDSRSSSRSSSKGKLGKVILWLAIIGAIVYYFFIK